MRAWLVKVADRWTAVNPETGEELKKMPVDVEALASGKYGPKQSAYNVVPLSVRSGEPNSRVTLGIDVDFKDGQEAMTTLRLVKRVVNSGLEGRVQRMITDLILRGVHQTRLFRDHGIMTVNKVYEAPESKENGFREVLNQKGKRIKTLPLGLFSHRRADGAECKHLLEAYDGALVEVDYDQDATNLVVVSAPLRQQIKRAKEITTTGHLYRFNVRYCGFRGFLYTRSD